jgi:hypothetical protein
MNNKRTQLNSLIIKLVTNRLVDELCGSDRSPIHLHLTTVGLTKFYPRVASQHTPPNHAHYRSTTTTLHVLINLTLFTTIVSRITCSPMPHPLPPSTRHPPTPVQFLRRMNELADSVLSFAVLFKSIGYGRTRLFPLSSPRTGTTVGAGWRQ